MRFKSHTEPYLNTDNELIAHIVLGVTSYYAQLEALRISDRTKAGLARARASGKVIGRPDGFERWRERLVAMRDEKDEPGNAALLQHREEVPGADGRRTPRRP